MEVGGLPHVRVWWGAVWHMYGVSIMPAFTCMLSSANDP
jgi:hypothetical protein